MESRLQWDLQWDPQWDLQWDLQRHLQAPVHRVYKKDIWYARSKNFKTSYNLRSISAMSGSGSNDGTAAVATVSTSIDSVQRDRYTEATADMASHIGEKVISVLRHPDNQARMQSLLDPIVSHIIQRVFPYILLSAILFLILFVLTMGTFWVVIRGGGSSSSSRGAATAVVAAAAALAGRE